MCHEAKGLVDGLPGLIGVGLSNKILRPGEGLLQQESINNCRHQEKHPQDGGKAPPATCHCPVALDPNRQAACRLLRSRPGVSQPVDSRHSGDDAKDEGSQKRRVLLVDECVAEQQWLAEEQSRCHPGVAASQEAPKEAVERGGARQEDQVGRQMSAIRRVSCGEHMREQAACSREKHEMRRAMVGEKLPMPKIIAVPIDTQIGPQSVFTDLRITVFIP